MRDHSPFMQEHIRANAGVKKTLMLTSVSIRKLALVLTDMYVWTYIHKTLLSLPRLTLMNEKKQFYKYRFLFKF
jgi:hypothetical protein